MATSTKAIHPGAPVANFGSWKLHPLNDVDFVHHLAQAPHGFSPVWIEALFAQHGGPGVSVIHDLHHNLIDFNLPENERDIDGGINEIFLNRNLPVKLVSLPNEFNVGLVEDGIAGVRHFYKIKLNDILLRLLRKFYAAHA